jgi:hypothetical protein
MPVLKKNPNFKKKILFCLLSVGLILFETNTVLSQSVLDNIRGGGGKSGWLRDTAVLSGFDTKNEKQSLVELIGTYVQYFLSFMGVIFLGLMIYGGYVWMKARGNDSESTKAKGIMMDSGIGLIIIFSAYVISSFILSSLTTTTVQP